MYNGKFLVDFDMNNKVTHNRTQVNDRGEVFPFPGLPNLQLD